MAKNYLIVGASSGIGESCVHKLADEADSLTLVGRNIEKLNALKNQYAKNIDVYPLSYDLTDIENIKSIFKVCNDHQMKFDGMVYSSGVDGTWPIKMNNTARMQQMMIVNCFAFVELAKNFYSKRHSHEESSIVAISSIASLTSDIGMSGYCASKAALNSYVKTMAKEFVHRKIRVNAVLPAGVSTPMAAQKDALLAGITDLKAENTFLPDVQPLGMIPSDMIASQVKYLLSDQAAYITGELLTVSAGRFY